MARFRYLGEDMAGHSHASGVRPEAFRFHLQDGSWLEHRSVDPDGFEIGQDIGLDVDDDRVLRHLRADPRFEEI